LAVIKLFFGNVEFLNFILFEMSNFKEIKKEGYYYYYYYYYYKTIGFIMLEVQSPGTYQKSCLYLLLKLHNKLLLLLFYS